MERLIIGMFFVLSAAFIVVGLWSSWLLAPKKPSPEKSSLYECGIRPEGRAWIQFRAGYYVYALFYVIFDIETVFLYPWAVTFGQRGVGWFVFFEMLVFVVVLLGGLAYAWKEGTLKWR